MSSAIPKCPQCKGHKIVHDGGYPGTLLPCPSCKATGLAPTTSKVTPQEAIPILQELWPYLHLENRKEVLKAFGLRFGTQAKNQVEKKDLPPINPIPKPRYARSKKPRQNKKAHAPG